MRSLVILLVVLIVYALVDRIRAEGADVPAGVPNPVWVVLIVIFPGAGAIAWLVVSRLSRQAQRATSGPGPSYGGYPTRPVSPRRPVTRQVAPDDDPEFLASLDRPADETEDDDEKDPDSRS